MLSERVCLAKVGIPLEQRFHSYTRGGCYTRAAIFDDVRSLTELWDKRGLLCLLDSSNPPARTFTLYDDGTHGHDAAGNGLYSNRCLTICPGKLDSLGVVKEAIRYGGPTQRPGCPLLFASRFASQIR